MNNATTKPRSVLVVSTGRTGTMALATHLTACYADKVCALHEPPPTRSSIRPAGNRFMVGRLTREKLVRTLAKCRSKLPLTGGQHIYVESNPSLAGFIDAFPDVFGDFQVLHVVRDPRTYVASAINWGVFRGLKGLLARGLPYWVPKPEQVNPDAPPWSGMSHVERLAWHWRFINEHLDRGRQLYPGRYHRIRFEDLFARDGSGLAQVVQWMRLPPTEGLTLAANAENVNASRPGKAAEWRDWADEDKRILLKNCAPLMREYGYDVTPDAQLLEPAGL